MNTKSHFFFIYKFFVHLLILYNPSVCFFMVGRRKFRSDITVIWSNMLKELIEIEKWQKFTKIVHVFQILVLTDLIFFFFFGLKNWLQKNELTLFILANEWIIVSNIRGIWVFRYNSHMENMLFIISKHIIVVNWRKFNIECSVKYIYVFMLHSFCQSSARGISVSNLYIEIGTLHAMADRSLWSVF